MNPNSGEVPYVPHPAVPEFAQPRYTAGAGNGKVRRDTVDSFIPGRMSAMSGSSQGAEVTAACSTADVYIARLCLVP